MLTMLMMMSMMTTVTFFFLKHPMSMGLILLIQSLLISLITGFFSLNYWFSYILFLIMIGGMLVLFIYMTSIASNEMFKYSNKLTLTIMIMSLVTLVILLTKSSNINLETMNMEMQKMDSFNELELMLNKYLNFPSNITLTFLIIYLFITLVAVVKITNISHGPLRKT